MSRKRFEDIIRTVLKGKEQKNALDFVDYLWDDEMSYNDPEFCWTASYKGKSVIHIKIGGFDNQTNDWIIWSADDYNDEKVICQTDEHIKEFAWSNVCYCGNCGEKCTPGRSTEIFGKTFDRVCHSSMIFINPKSEELDYLKKLVDIRKNNILNSTQ